MSLIAVVLILVVIGIGLYLFNTYVTKIDPTMKKIIFWVVIIAVLLWLLSLFTGFRLSDLNTVRVGH